MSKQQMVFTFHNLLLLIIRVPQICNKNLNKIINPTAFLKCLFFFKLQRTFKQRIFFWLFGKNIRP